MGDGVKAFATEDSFSSIALFSSLSLKPYLLRCSVTTKNLDGDTTEVPHDTYRVYVLVTEYYNVLYVSAYNIFCSKKKN